MNCYKLMLALFFISVKNSNFIHASTKKFFNYAEMNDHFDDFLDEYINEFTKRGDRGPNGQLRGLTILLHKLLLLQEKN